MRYKRISRILASIVLICIVVMPATAVTAESVMPKGTKIAGITVENMTDQAIKQQLENNIKIWKTGSPVLVRSEFEQIELPRSIFRFQVDKSIQKLSKRTKRRFTNFFMKPANVELPLIVTIDLNAPEMKTFSEKTYINTKNVTDQLLDMAKNLREDSSITLTYTNEDAIPFTTIASAEINSRHLSHTAIEEITSTLHDIKIAPNTAFSYLNDLPLYDKLEDAAANNAVTSGLYQLFLQTNFDIAERHTQLHKQEAIEAGTEAFVQREKNDDFIVWNPNDEAFILNAKEADDEIVLEIKSTHTGHTYGYELETEEIPYRTIYRYTTELPAGSKQLIQSGKPGMDIKNYRIDYDHDLFPVDTILQAHDTYLPVPEIILTGTESEDTTAETEQTDDTPASAEEINNLQDNIAALSQALSDMQANHFAKQDSQQQILDKITNQVSDFETKLKDLNQEFKEETKTDNADLDDVRTKNKKLLDEIQTYQNDIDALKIQVKKLQEQSDHTTKKDEGDPE